MKLHLFLAMTGILVISACQLHQKENQNAIYTIDAESIIDSESQTQSLAQIATKIKTIPLETTPTSLVGEISDIVLLEDNFLILSHNKCMLFGPNGKYIANIGSKGNGPSEYLYLEGVFVINHCIYLFDSGKNKIHKYNENGGHLAAIAIDTCLKGVNGVSFLEDGLFSAFTPDRGYPTMRRELTFFDTLGVVRDSILHRTTLPEPANIHWYFKECSYVHWNGTTRYKNVLNDTVYTVRHTDGRYTTAPSYIFHLGKHKAIPDARVQVSKSFMAPKVFNPFQEMAKIELLGESRKFLLFKANGESAYFYNKKDNLLHKWVFDNEFIPIKITNQGVMLGVIPSENDDDNPSIGLITL